MSMNNSININMILKFGSGQAPDFSCGSPRIVEGKLLVAIQNVILQHTKY
jgi:hypothetical protein